MEMFRVLSSEFSVQSSAFRVLSFQILNPKPGTQNSEPGTLNCYELAVQIEPEGLSIEERTPHLSGYKTLLIPYLRDGGWADTTQVHRAGSLIRLALGAEIIRFELEGEIEHLLNLPYGYENRRGLCGLLRVDLAEPLEGIKYRVAIEA